MQIRGVKFNAGFYMFMTVALVVAAMTGNCSCFGYERDYVGEHLDQAKDGAR